MKECQKDRGLSGKPNWESRAFKGSVYILRGPVTWGDTQSNISNYVGGESCEKYITWTADTVVQGHKLATLYLLQKSHLNHFVGRYPKVSHLVPCIIPDP